MAHLQANRPDWTWFPLILVVLQGDDSMTFHFLIPGLKPGRDRRSSICIASGLLGNWLASATDPQRPPAKCEADGVAQLESHLCHKLFDSSSSIPPCLGGLGPPSSPRPLVW